MEVRAPEIVTIPQENTIAIADTTSQDDAVVAPHPVVSPVQSTPDVATPPPTEVSASEVSKKPSVHANETRVSAFSLSGLKARKELGNQHSSRPSSEQQLPTEPFNETDLMLQWNKYAQRLSDKGQKIMESLMLLSDPRLEGSKIIHELPNGSAKDEFEEGKLELLGYLRGKLHNHDIAIEVIVNEKMDRKKAFLPQEKYNRLNEINPSLDLLRRTFDLEF